LKSYSFAADLAFINVRRRWRRVNSLEYASNIANIQGYDIYVFSVAESVKIILRKHDRVNVRHSKQQSEQRKH
jgi:hypothetical protein